MESLLEDQGGLGTQLNDKAFTKHVLGRECNRQHHQEGTRTGWRVEPVLRRKAWLCTFSTRRLHSHPSSLHSFPSPLGASWKGGQGTSEGSRTALSSSSGNCSRVSSPSIVRAAPARSHLLCAAITALCIPVKGTQAFPQSL